MMWAAALLLIWLINVTLGTGEAPRCEVIRKKICQEMPYSTVYLPNMWNKETQEGAAHHLLQFPVLGSRKGWSRDIRIFLCIAAFPPCLPYRGISPCRSYCRKVSDDYKRVKRKEWMQFGELACRNFPEDTFPNCYENSYQLNASISSCKCSCKFPYVPGPPSLHVGGIPGCAHSCNMSELGQHAPSLHTAYTSLTIVCFIFCCIVLLGFLLKTEDFAFIYHPIVYIYIGSALYFLGFLIRYVIGHQNLSCKDNVYVHPSTDYNTHCLLVFILVYFSEAANCCWVFVFCLFCFIQIRKKWDIKDLTCNAKLVHLFGWGVPSILTLAGLRYVDGDPNTGICSIGTQMVETLIYFKIIPFSILTISSATLLGLTFIPVLPDKNRKLLREHPSISFPCYIVVVAYILPYCAKLGLYVYTALYKGEYEEEYACSCGNKIKIDSFINIYPYLLPFITGVSPVYWLICPTVRQACIAYFEEILEKNKSSASNSTAVVDDPRQVGPPSHLPQPNDTLSSAPYSSDISSAQEYGNISYPPSSYLHCPSYHNPPPSLTSSFARRLPYNDSGTA